MKNKDKNTIYELLLSKYNEQKQNHKRKKQKSKYFLRIVYVAMLCCFLFVPKQNDIKPLSFV